MMAEAALLPLPETTAAAAAPVSHAPIVRLDAFEGPLDVLLHLIRSQQMNIFDIPMARLTAQYLEIIEAQAELDLDVAGDYLVMASTLMQLKSKMLLPRPILDEEGNEVDPRAELVAQLLAYEQYRLLAQELEDLPRAGRDIFLRRIFPEADEVERPLAEPDLDALILAFRAVLRRVGGEVRHQIFTEKMSVREQMLVVLERLAGGSRTLEELVDPSDGREGVVTTLLAVLELWRQRSLMVVQSECYATVLVMVRQEQIDE